MSASPTRGLSDRAGGGKTVTPLTGLRRSIPLVGLSIGALLLVLLLAEFGFRLLAPGENIPQREYDNRLGWRGRPNLDCVLREKRFSISISQNAGGFRDAERSREKPSGTSRVMCGGDSFTWGWAVEQSAIYTHILERRLKDEGQSVEVLNVGVGGYSTDQVLLYLRDEGLDYAPDLVVYQAAKNDIRGNSSRVAEGIYLKPRFALRTDGGLALTNSPVPPLSGFGQLKYLISRGSRLAYFLKHRLHLMRFGARPGGPGGAPERQAKPPDSVDDAFRLFCRLVEEMQEECEGRGARFAILIDFDLGQERQEYWDRECADVEAHFIKEYLLASEEVHGTPAFIQRDGHWSESGHWWVAEYLYENVLPRAGIIPERG